MKITGKAFDKDLKSADSPRFFYGKRIARTWIMVIDRKKAHIFHKSPSGLELIADAHPDADDAATPMENRSLIAPRESQKRHEETSFARSISAWLEESYDNDAFDELVLVAAPRMLGDLRSTLSAAMAERVVGEIAKDLTNMPVPDIKRHLANVVYFRD